MLDLLAPTPFNPNPKSKACPRTGGDSTSKIDMTPEEYKRIKEDEKEHLRALKKLKQTARLLERRKSVNQALGNMVGGSKDALGTHEEMLDKLTLETAQQEARLEIALENTTLKDATGTPVRSLEQLEEDVHESAHRNRLADFPCRSDATLSVHNGKTVLEREHPLDRGVSSGPAHSFNR